MTVNNGFKNKILKPIMAAITKKDITVDFDNFINFCFLIEVGMF